MRAVLLGVLWWYGSVAVLALVGQVAMIVGNAMGQTTMVIDGEPASRWQLAWWVVRMALLWPRTVWLTLRDIWWP